MIRLLSFSQRLCAVCVILNASSVFASEWKGIEVTPSVTLREAYDTNITQANSGELHDTVTTAAAGIKLLRKEELQNWTFSTDVKQKFFSDHARLNNTEETAEFKYEKQLSEYNKFSVKENFSHLYEPDGFSNAFGQRGGLDSIFYQSLRLDFSHDVTELSSWKFRYGNDYTAFAQDSHDDSLLNTLGVARSFTLSSTLTLIPEVVYSRRDFHPGPSANVGEITTTVRKYLKEELYADLLAGIDLISSYNKDQYGRPYFRAALTQNMNATTQCSIVLEKQHLLTAYTEDILDSWQAQARIAKDVSRRFRALVVAFYGQGEYVVSREEIDFTGAEAGLYYKLNDSVEAQFEYRYAEDTSSFAGQGYVRSTVNTGLKFEF